MSLGNLLTHMAGNFPNKEAIAFGDWRLSYNELESRANRLANAVLSLGLKKGDRCAVMLKNRGEWGELFFGLAKAGVITVPVNFRFISSEVEYVLLDSGPRAIIYEDEYDPIIKEVCKNNPSLAVHLICLDGGSGLDYEELLARNSQDLPRVDIAGTDPVLIFYTSGTTGNPKGILISHESQIISIKLTYGSDYGNITAHSRMLLMMPLFHANSANFLQALIMAGGSVVINRSSKFDAKEVLNIIEKEAINAISVVPTMLTMFFEVLEKRKERIDLTTMRKCLVGSAPCYTETKKKFAHYFPNANLVEAYGATELTWATVLHPEDQFGKISSVGLPVSGKEVCLLDENKNRVKQGEVGELYVRGIGIPFIKYWNKPEETKAAFYEDWITVGDMAWQDEEGYYYLSDRKKDMIISGGENIYPTEVENIIIEHPDVSEVAVIGIRDELWGERVHAVVVPKPGAKITQADIIEYCKGRIAGYKRLRSCDFADSLPRTSTGKLSRKTIRENYK